MEFKKYVSITNCEDLIKHCEIREDCLSIIEEIKKNRTLEEVLQYFNMLGFDCDDIYDFFIYEIDDYDDLMRKIKD